MKKYFGFFFLGFLFSCIQHQEKETIAEAYEVSDDIDVKYAEGFDVKYSYGGVTITTHSIVDNSFFSDSVFITLDENASIGFNYNEIRFPLTAVSTQSSTHIAFLEVLNKLYLVNGLCGMEYIQNSIIRDSLVHYGTQEICAADRTDIEKMQELNPDLFLIYPFETEGKKNFDASGIRSLYIAEYLEQTPLARLEWIKLFGLITGKAKEANVYFDQVEKEYLALVNQTKESDSRFILNLPYKENWFMPAANSLVVNLFEDAGLSYYYQSSGATENETRSTESVWNDAMVAEYWIIMASRPTEFSLNDLLAEEAVYKEFLAVKKNQVIFCNTATSDYFVQGVVEPQIILKDILFATGKLKNYKPKYFFNLK